MHSNGVNLGGGGIWKNTQSIAVDSTNNPVLNFGGLQSAIFVVNNPIGVAKVWSMLNQLNALTFFCSFTISAIDDQTFPNNWIMSDNRWEVNGAKKWTPLEVGKYTMQGFWDGTNWIISISGVNA